MSKKVLVLEDEENIRSFLVINLKRAGYDVIQAGCGEDALEEYHNNNDVIVCILDVMLPGIDGYSLLEQIKPTGTPVIFLTAKGSVADRVQGLRAGADDYLVKPFEIVELLARVETVLRRAGKTKDRLQIGDVTIDESSMQVTKAGQPVSLTKKEYELLLLFARNQNMALFRETIYERVWDGEYTGDSRTVDLHVQRLRKKLGWQDRLSAVYKVGYRLEVKE